MYSFDRSKQNIALVVDDNPDSLGMVSTALESQGMVVLVARDGNSAIDLVGRVDPDVILMDAVMPAPDGFETCRLLKAGKMQTPAPIIFMTGLSEPENIVRGLQAGGVDYITKPVKIDELLARIHIHINNAKLLDSARAALDNSGYALLAFHTSGTLNWGTPSAVRLVEEPLLNAEPASGNVQAFKLWLTTSAREARSDNLPFTLGELTLNFVGVSAENDYLVKVAVQLKGNNEDALASAFGLTKREAEVLYWLSLGKSNKDIAEILSLSARTVNKHLEQVFTKLGVDNRTSAAVIADRVLHLPD